MSEQERLKNIAISTLCAVCEDHTSPKNAQAMAARTLLELIGEIGKLQSEKPNENKALYEMSRAELDAELRRFARPRRPRRPNAVQNKIRSSNPSKRKRSTKSDS
jgi:hypothetical protein